MMEKIEGTIYLLYQNREAEGMTAVKEWLRVFQELLSDSEHIQDGEVKRFGILMLRELLDAYRNRDIMEMADCLEEKSSLFIQAYFQEIKTK